MGIENHQNINFKGCKNVIGFCIKSPDGKFSAKYVAGQLTNETIPDLELFKQAKKSLKINSKLPDDVFVISHIEHDANSNFYVNNRHLNLRSIPKLNAIGKELLGPNFSLMGTLDEVKPFFYLQKLLKMISKHKHFEQDGNIAKVVQGTINTLDHIFVNHPDHNEIANGFVYSGLNDKSSINVACKELYKYISDFLKTNISSY